MLVAELVIRFYHFVRFDISIIDGQPRHDTNRGFSSMTLDDLLGWRATENYRFDGTKTSADGTSYPVRISSDANGFRMFGNLSSGRPKLLVIGDSFTQAVEVSDDKTYFAIIRGLFDIEVFAYGGGGYGSLQEYMILNRYFDLIKPDLVLWQYSTNDFINNSPELEAASRINNNGLVRPYLWPDEIQYILPKRLPEVRAFSIRYCRFCYVILNRLDKLHAQMPLETVEMETHIGGSAYCMFLQSLKVTDKIMEMVRGRAGSIPIIAFVVGTGFPYGSEYEGGFTEISRHHNIILLDGIDHAVREAEKAGKIARSADRSHWNDLGHRIAGQALADSLRDSGVLSSR